MGRWTPQEVKLFEQGCKVHGWGEWTKIAAMIPSRSSTQVKGHAQKLLVKLRKQELQAEKTQMAKRDNRKQQWKATTNAVATTAVTSQKPSTVPTMMSITTSAPKIASPTASLLGTVEGNVLEREIQGAIGHWRKPNYQDVEVLSHDFSDVTNHVDNGESTTPRTASRVTATQREVVRGQSGKPNIQEVVVPVIHAPSDVTKRGFINDAIGATVSNIAASYQATHYPRTMVHMMNGLTAKQMFQRRSVSMSPDNQDAMQATYNGAKGYLREVVTSNASNDGLGSSSSTQALSPVLCLLKREKYGTDVDPLARYYLHASTYISGYPTNYDVLCDEDDTYFNHVGNRRLRIMAMTTLYEYIESSTGLLPANNYVKKKREDVQRTRCFIIEFVHSLSTCHPPCRFLAMDATVGRWRELNYDYSNMKIQETFRECKEVVERSIPVDSRLRF